MVMRDCAMIAGGMSLIPYGSNPPEIILGMTNNVFENTTWYFVQGYLGSETPMYLQFRNNLFYRGAVTFNLTDPLLASWYVHDNLFVTNTLVTSSAATTNSNNGYYISPALSGTMGTNKTLSSLSFEVGPLGRFYYPTNGSAGSLTDLVNAGTKSATNAVPVRNRVRT
jgi:hypothetical protein